MSNLSTQPLLNLEQGWPGPITARWPGAVAARGPASRRPAWKCGRTILIAAIGCLLGLFSCREPQFRFLAAFLGTVLANHVCFAVPKLVRWLPSRIGAAARWLYVGAYNRRRLQFRLRTLFVLVLLCGVALTGWNWISPYHKARREQAAFIAAIEGLGGTVVSANYGPSWFPVQTAHVVSYNRQPLGDKDLAYLSTFPAAQFVIHCDLSSTLVTDACLAHLAKWSRIRDLRLDHCWITDRGISEFARVKTGGLGNLHVVDCRGITDGSVEDLLRLAPDILEIGGTSITPSGAGMLQAHVWPRLPGYESDPLNVRTSPTQSPGGSPDRAYPYD